MSQPLRQILNRINFCIGKGKAQERLLPGAENPPGMVTPDCRTRSAATVMLLPLPDGGHKQNSRPSR